MSFVLDQRRASRVLARRTLHNRLAHGFAKPPYIEVDDRIDRFDSCDIREGMRLTDVEDGDDGKCRLTDHAI